MRGTTILRASSVTFPTIINEKYSAIVDWDGINISLMVNGIANTGTNEFTGTGDINNYDDAVRIGRALNSDNYRMIGNIK